MIKKICIIIILLLIPWLARADVFINEIAWMGTTASANAEWIELFNSSPNPVILDGWSLVATDGSPSIALSGTLSGSGYGLLERTSDETLPGISAFLIYSGSLSNTGEHLQLKDNLGNTIDEADATAGWPGGDNTSKQTMQRNSAAWTTAVATPGAQNAVGTSTSSTGNATTTSPVITTKVSEETNTLETIEVKRDPIFTARMVAPDFGTAGVALQVMVLVKEGGKKDLVSGKFAWSMGDGMSYTYDHNESLNHIYHYSGTYTITLTYYSNIFKTEPDSIHKKVVTIVPSAVTIKGSTDDGGVVIENTSSKEIALDGWAVTHHDKKFIFPKYTVVAKDQLLSISSKTLGFTTDQSVVLSNPSGIPMKKYIPPQQEVLDDEAMTAIPPLPEVKALPKEVTPEIKPFASLWQKNKWYFIAGIGGIGAILAYFIWRLYAERDEWL